MPRIATALFTLVLLTAACGDDDTDPTVADDTQTVTENSGSENSASGGLDDDEIAALLAGDERAEVLGPLVSLGIEESAAECVMGEALRSGVDVLGEVDDELLALLAGCGVTVEQLAAIGLGTTEDQVAERLRSLTSAITPEVQAALRASEEARDATATLLVGQGFTEDQAGCVVQALTDLEDLALLEDLDALLELFTGCGLTIADLTLLS